MDNLLRAKKLTLQMAEDRGYIVTDTEYADMSYYDFLVFVGKESAEGIRRKISVVYDHSVNPNKQLCVVFVTRHSGTTQSISGTVLSEASEWVEKVSDADEVDVVIVGDAPLYRGASSQFQTDNYYHQYFAESELKFNRNRSRFNSKVELIPEPEATELREKMKIKPGGSNSMLHTDQIARYYGFRVGDFIRCERNTSEINKFCPTQISYRTVTEDHSEAGK